MESWGNRYMRFWFPRIIIIIWWHCSIMTCPTYLSAVLWPKRLQVQRKSQAKPLKRTHSLSHLLKCRFIPSMSSWIYVLQCGMGSRKDRWWVKKVDFLLKAQQKYAQHWNLRANIKRHFSEIWNSCGLRQINIWRRNSLDRIQDKCSLLRTTWTLLAHLHLFQCCFTAHAFLHKTPLSLAESLQSAKFYRTHE